MEKKHQGLRERKRLQTRQRLEAVAIELVLRDGLDKTTIESISHQADVSPRTFFNYFDSKEEALLGLVGIEIDQELVNQYFKQHENDKVTEIIVGLLVSLIGPSLLDHSKYKLRRKVLKTYPQLADRQISLMSKLTKQLSKNVQQAFLSITDENWKDYQIELLMSMCTSAVRISIRECMESGKKVRLSTIETRAQNILYEVNKKLDDK